MDLKATRKTVFEVNSYDLDKFIVAMLPNGGWFEFVAVEECGNDSQHSFSVDGKIASYNESRLNTVLSGEFTHCSTQIILDYLCREGVIESGNYLIAVSW